MVRGTKRGERSEPMSIAGYDLKPGMLISFQSDSLDDTVAALSDATGAKQVAYAADFAGPMDLQQVSGADVTIFSNLGVAVMDADPDQALSLASLPAASNPIRAVEAEPIFFAFGEGLSEDFVTYLRGYKDAVDHIFARAIDPGAAMFGAQGTQPVSAFSDTQQVTWGLQASGIENSTLSGRGVKVAILDTGLDLDHPDFRGRAITPASFIPNQTVDDENGHGTHCTGTACGPRTPTRGPRYGIAYEAEIFIGKVLTNQGAALGRSTLAGLEWAVRHGCHIVSMSLGGMVLPGQSYSQAFETTAANALRQGTLVIAAAGNNSHRSQGLVKPVSNPANCPSVMSVAALDRAMRVADFSNAAINPDAAVDIAGPGVDIYSSSPEPAAPQQPPFYRQWAAQYDRISGTSMATPHVAGVAALLKEQDPSLTAGGLWRLLSSRARPLPYPAGDVGAGLVRV